MLYTQCRGCGEVFVLQVAHITLARGRVRCNLCGTVFDALETLSAEKPYEDEDLLLHEQSHAPPLLTKSFLRQEDDSIAESSHLLASETSTTTDDHDVVDDYWSLDDTVEADEAKESEAEETVSDESEYDNPPAFISPEEKSFKADLPYADDERDKKSGQKLWAFLSVALIASLLWQGQQALAAGRLQLPVTEWAATVCRYAGCAELDKPLDLDSVSLVSRNIRSHPGRDNALIISASMIKTQSDDRRFPALEISLSDLNGQVIAMRRFLAAEYLPNDIVKAGFVTNTLVPITLEIENPGEQAVAFEIGFSQP